MKLRSHLLLPVVVIAVPLLVFAALMVFLVGDREERAIERGLRDTARALSLAVEREIASSVSTLQALAASDHLETGDFAGFYEEARRVRAAHEVWPTVFLTDARGQEIFTLLMPLGSPVPNIGAAPDVVETMRTARPYVSDLKVGPVSGMRLVSVHLPVLARGRVKYLVSATLTPEHLGGLLTSQAMSPQLVALLVDRTGATIAGTGESRTWTGRPAPRALMARARTAREGFLADATIGGRGYSVAFARVPNVDFLVAVGAPPSAAPTRSLWPVAAASAALLAAALALAAVMAERIRDPILALASDARAFGRGEPVVDAAPSPVDEVEIVRRALVEAAAVARERAVEHERRLAADAARREAEAAARALRAVEGIAAIGLRHLSLDELLQDLLGRLRASLRADTAVILLASPDERTMRVAASDGPGDLRDEHVPLAAGGGIAALVETTAEGATLDDPSAVDVVRTAVRVPVGSLVGAPLRVDGRAIGAVYLGTRAARRFEPADLALIRVVADRVALAIDRARTHESEVVARADAEAANRGKDEFLAMLGHELRNPLATIANASHVLSRVAGQETIVVHARDVIARQVRHVTRIVDDLLDVSRVMTGKIVLDRAPVDLARVVRQSIDGVREAGRAVDRVIDVETLPVRVEADEVRLTQIVDNLVLNALKYTPRGGAIRVRVGSEAGQAVLTIADSGIGIAPELLPRIFDLFVQGEQPLHRPQGGLGIGLTLVRRLVELHGGTIVAESAGSGRGSVFTVRLPRATAAAPAPTPARPPIRPDGRRVLVVEDNADARAILCSLLQLEGHEVYEADNGGRGIRAALQHPVDVALVDLGLPDIDGYEVARTLRASLPSIVLVALTGYGESDHRRRAADAGFDQFLVKPVEPDRLVAVLAAGRLV